MKSEDLIEIAAFAGVAYMILQSTRDRRTLTDLHVALIKALENPVPIATEEPVKAVEKPTPTHRWEISICRGLFHFQGG